MTPSPALTRAFSSLLAAAAALIAPAAADAAAWVAQQSVPIVAGRTNQPATAQIGVDAAGNAVLAMLVDKGPPRYVQVAGRVAGGDWGPATELGTVSLNTGGPALAVDPAGNALIVWVDSSATAPCNAAANACLHVVSRSPAGTFTTETTFTNGGTAMFDPAVALDPSGNGQATIIWRYTPSAGVNGVQALRGSIGGAWPATASNVGATTTSSIATPRVAIDRNGAPVAWFLTSVTGQYDVRSSNLRGSTWTAAGSRMSSTTGAFSGLYVKTNRQGDIDAIAAGQTTGNTDVRTITWDAAAAGFPSPPQTIYSVASTHNLNGPQIETGSNGEAVAVWTDDLTSPVSVRSVLAAVRSGGAWSGAITLDSDTADTRGPALAMDAAGNATAVWHSNSPALIQRYAVRPAGGSFGPSLDGPAGNAAPVVAADAAGNVHAAWALGSTAVDTAVFDPVPPALSAVTASPLSPLAAAATQLGVTATDLWSGPPAVRWDFGDGQRADGSSVAHSFAGAGLFSVKATATDGAGNSSASSADLLVGKAPGPAPLPRPVAGRTFNLEPVTGTMRVKVPGSDRFVPLVAPTQVRDGSIIDARKGRVRITIDNGRGGLDTAEFYGGIFRFTQPKPRRGRTRFANLYLFGGSFKGCPAAPKSPQIAALSRARSKKQAQGNSVRHLWGSGAGAFRTVGRFSSATVRGTTWLTDDRCSGTLTRVTAGKVGVRDFVKRRTVVLRRGARYFAQPAPKR